MYWYSSTLLCCAAADYLPAYQWVLKRAAARSRTVAILYCRRKKIKISVLFLFHSIFFFFVCWLFFGDKLWFITTSHLRTWLNTIWSLMCKNSLANLLGLIRYTNRKKSLHLSTSVLCSKKKKLGESHMRVCSSSFVSVIMNDCFNSGRSNIVIITLSCNNLCK